MDPPELPETTVERWSERPEDLEAKTSSEEDLDALLGFLHGVLVIPVLGYTLIGETLAPDRLVTGLDGQFELIRQRWSGGGLGYRTGFVIGMLLTPVILGRMMGRN